MLTTDKFSCFRFALCVLSGRKTENLKLWRCISIGTLHGNLCLGLDVFFSSLAFSSYEELLQPSCSGLTQSSNSEQALRTRACHFFWYIFLLVPGTDLAAIRYGATSSRSLRRPLTFAFHRTLNFLENLFKCLPVFAQPACSHLSSFLFLFTLITRRWLPGERLAETTRED